MLILPLYALTPQQLQVLQSVRDVAKSIPDHRGETYENTLSAICLTESSGGRDLIGDFEKGTSITRASLGAMQIQVATARYVSTRIKSLAYLEQYSDAHLANKLVSDIKFSATIAAHYITILKRQRDHYFNVVSGYNGGMNNLPYFKRVMQNMRLIKKLLKQGKIT